MKFVDDILNAKGRDIWFVHPDATVFDAVKLMSEKSIGALLVMEGESLRGIITERDYARKIILEGRSSRQTPVTDVMTRRVLYVGPDRPIGECMALMTTKRVRHLPVVKDKRVVGLLSIGDLVKAIIEEQQVMIDQLQEYIAG
ncbi:MAG: CBS domain-containing protein [Gammaproteobacteria bacterium]|nr:CBS domain-containing protein [Gammaproteobacteria bacterium]MBA3732288.1 CBS domain-containing protein [Gammaproteobacteria bacterium]